MDQANPAARRRRDRAQLRHAPDVATELVAAPGRVNSHRADALPDSVDLNRSAARSARYPADTSNTSFEQIISGSGHHSADIGSIPAKLRKSILNSPNGEKNRGSGLDNRMAINSQDQSQALVSDDSKDNQLKASQAKDGHKADLDINSSGGGRKRKRKRQASAPTKAHNPWLAGLREIIMIVVVAIILSALVRAFVVQVFIIPSESMENTLLVGDRVVASKFVPRFQDINRGDIVVFEDSQGWLGKVAAPTTTDYFTKTMVWLGLMPDKSDQRLIKRVIGLPGDHVQCCDAKKNLVVNGISIQETSYLKPGVEPSLKKFDVVVPPGHLWVMGDNRDHSGDSREHMDSPGGGFVAIADVQGRAFSIIFPLGRMQLLGDTKTFAGVPKPGT